MWLSTCDGFGALGRIAMRVVGWPTLGARRALSTAPHMRMWTPSDLVVFYDSPWASWMDRLASEEPLHPLVQQRDAPDPFLSMLGRKGTAGEREVTRKLFVNLGLDVADLSSASGASPRERAAVTQQALLDRPDVIYQAPLAAGEFHGIADFLVRTDLLDGEWASRRAAAVGAGARLIGGPTAPLSPGRYTVWDAKLTRRARPQQLIQLCCYAEMLEQMQGALPETVALVLGGSDAKITSFRLADHLAHYRSLRRRFLRFQSRYDASAGPPMPPSRSAPAGAWRGLADSLLLQRDDLRLVARLSRRQATLLHATGVATVTELARLTPDQAVPGIDPAGLSRLRRQAALQLEYRAAPEKPPPFETLPWSSGVGLSLLPWPSNGDLFFDLEGFPLAERAPAVPAQRRCLTDFIVEEGEAAADELERGREYLWGVATRRGAGMVGSAAPEGRERQALFERDDEFVAWWAHTHEQEKRALEGFVDWATAMRRADPAMHIYHYGAYELSALRRLTMRHATREEEVDALLRSNVLVDLYEVVRGALLLGTDNYSIKSVEKVYRATEDPGGTGRGTAVVKGDQSVVVYDAWLEQPDGQDTAHSAVLASLLEYNRDDCISTRQLADFLWKLRCSAPEAARRAPCGADATAWAEPPSERAAAAADRAAEEVLEVSRLQERLSAPGPWPDGSPLANEAVRETLSALLCFHKREAKPGWWRRFDWLSAPAEALVEDDRTLGLLSRTEAEPFKSSPRKRRLVYEYRSQSPQECKIEAGAAVVLRGHAVQLGGGSNLDAPGLGIPATLVSKTRTAGLYQLECGEEPSALVSVLPSEFVDPAPIPAAVRTVVRQLALAPDRPSALSRFLLRRPPVPLRPRAAVPHSAAQGPSDSSERETAEWISSAVLQLEADYLCIQGPPGTGKTFVGSRAAAALIRAGRRVGVLAHSHAAVNNLLAKTLEVLSADGAPARALKIGGDKADVERMRARCADGVRLEHIASASGLKEAPLEEDVLLVGATTWAYANDVLHEKLDTLFVDEAGQLPLANLVGASRSSRNLVLLGDQMQLPAPCEGAHPAGSGQSCLDYLLRGAPTVPPELGIFLSRSYRLHPLLCSLVSELVYSGCLLAHPSTASRSLALAQRPPPSQDAARPPLISREAGIQVVNVHHSSNTHASPEEASTVAALWAELLRSDLRVGNAAPRALCEDDILVVAPYNAQVGLIRSLLPRLARVGTVDRFQGQEAPVVLLSLCHSSFAAVTAGVDQEEESPSNGSGRGLSFVLNLNRLNVALTRAQCLAIVVASPELTSVTVNSLREFREINFLARIIEVGGGQPMLLSKDVAAGG